MRHSGIFQSTLPARGATKGKGASPQPSPISIHAPRTGSDPRGLREERRNAIFQSTLPARGATVREAFPEVYSEFQSTLPARGATNTPEERKRVQDAFQSTLPARGATRQFDEDFQNAANFNPRSPHGERPMPQLPGHRLKIFQSTLPARGATLTTANCNAKSAYFNPRSPHGERRQGARKASVRGYFNPRSPHGERRCAV